MKIIKVQITVRIKCLLIPGCISDSCHLTWLLLRPLSDQGSSRRSSYQVKSSIKRMSYWYTCTAQVREKISIYSQTMIYLCNILENLFIFFLINGFDKSLSLLSTYINISSFAAKPYRYCFRQSALFVCVVSACRFLLIYQLFRDKLLHNF